MAIRIVYILDGKAPDIISEAKSWAFDDGFLRIFDQTTGADPKKMMVEIRADYVFSVEHVELDDADDGAKEAPKEPEKAPKKPRKRAKKA